MTDPIPGMVYFGREKGTRRLVTALKQASPVHSARVYFRRTTLSGWGSQSSCLLETWRAWVDDEEPEKGPDA